MLALSDPRPEDVAQSTRLRQGYQGEVPVLPCPFYIVYICANKGWKCWEVTP